MPDVENGFELTSVGGVASKTGQPAVWIKARAEGTTIGSGMLEPRIARSLAMQLIYAADAAETDAALWDWMKESGFEPEMRASILAAQRDYREKFRDDG